MHLNFFDSSTNVTSTFLIINHKWILKINPILGLPLQSNPVPESNAGDRQMKRELEVATPHSSPLMPSHTRRSSKKQSPLNHHLNRRKFQLLLQNLVPISFIPPSTLNFHNHEPLLNRLGLWDFVHLNFDVPAMPHLLAELIITYSPSKHTSFVNGKRVSISRTKLASVLKLPVKKERPKASEIGSPEKNETPFSADSIAFLEEFVCNWIHLHGDIWVMPPEIAEATRFIRVGQPLMVDWARLLWSMIEKEILQGKDLVSCYYASHLMFMLKSQIVSLSPGDGVGPVAEQKDEGNEKIIEEISAIQIVGNEEEDGCEEDNGDEQVDDGGMEAEGEGAAEMQEQDGEQKEDTSKVDENDQVAVTQTHGMEEVQSKDFVDEISFDFESDMVENEDRSPRLPIGDVQRHEEHQLRRCIVDGFEQGRRSEEGDGEEAKEMEIGENKPCEGCPAQGFDSVVTPSHELSPVFAPRIPADVAKDQDKYPSQLPHLSGQSHKRLRVDDDMENPMACDDDYDETCFENVQLWLRRWKSASESKHHREFEQSRIVYDSLMREIYRKDAFHDNLLKNRDEMLQMKNAEVYRLERELLQMEHLLDDYRKALSGCRKKFDEYVLQNPRQVEPLYRVVHGGDGLVLRAVEVERMEREEAEENLRILVEKMASDVVEKWHIKFDGYWQQVELLESRLKEKERDVSDIKELYARRKALKQQ